MPERLYWICASEAYSVCKRQVDSNSWTRQLQHGTIDYIEKLHSENFGLLYAGNVMLHI